MSDLHELEMYFGTVVTGSYFVPAALASQEAESKLKEAIENAVARTVLQQPCLQVGVAGDGPNTPDSHYVELGRIDLAQQIIWRYAGADETLTDASRDIVQKELDKPFTERDTRPPWKLIVLHQRDSARLHLIFVFHHVITDGTGAKIFHQYMLKNLNSPTGELDGRLDGHILTPPVVNLPPSQDNMAAHPLTMGFWLQDLWNSWKPGFLKDTSSAAAWAPFNMSAYKTVSRRLVVNQSTLQRILSACRKHNTTLTGLMHGITMISLASRLQTTGFIAVTPNNMRPHTPATRDFTPDEAIGVIVSSISHEFNAASVSEAKRLSAASANDETPARLADFLFDVAAKTRAEIKEGVDSGTTDNMIGLQATKRDFLDSIKARFGKPREISWMVTNLGVVDGRSTPGEWYIDDAFFTVCAERTGAAIIMSLIAVKGGDLCIDLSCQEGVVDGAVAEGILSDALRWFTYCAKEEPA